MIKQIGKNSKSISPLVAMKQWELLNTNPVDVVLIDSGSFEFSVALEYMDYTSGSAVLNRTCNIALEQQDADRAIYEEGITGSGFFDPSTDEQNKTGTYKRLVYTQMSKTFYNAYKNPFNLFGLETVDLPLSQTNRSLGNEFVLFTIPREIMGDRLVEGEVQMYDSSLDDNVTIYDDASGNMIAGNNLFSKIQEIRFFQNRIMQGTASNGC